MLLNCCTKTQELTLFSAPAERPVPMGIQQSSWVQPSALPSVVGCEPCLAFTHLGVTPIPPCAELGTGTPIFQIICVLWGTALAGMLVPLEH